MTADKKMLSFPHTAARTTHTESGSIFDAEKYKNDNAFGIKLVELRKSRKMSQKDLSDQLSSYHINVSSGAISKWEKGIALPNAVQFLALCSILELSDPLSCFTGAHTETPDYSPELNQKGLNILQTLKDALIASGQYAPKTRRTTKVAELIEMKPMRISTNRASAGIGNFLDDDQFETMDFPVSQVPEDADFGIRIVGESMMPYYSDGQIVWIERCQELNPGEVGIFIYDGEGYIKQYREEMPDADEKERYTFNGITYPKQYLVSFNKNYAPRLINPAFHFEIVGRVLN